ncbi:MAG: hypothetical protein VX587_03335 [Thermoproteota archaeon]|nr:hypothetical protein [Thermoproteota archaeon]
MEKTKGEIRSEYEKEYLERLAKQGKIKSEQKMESTISEEERTRKVEEAERIQTESAVQIQEATAAKIQSQIDIKNKQEILKKEVFSLIEELKELREQLSARPVKRKVTKKRAAPKRKTVKRKVTKKRAAPKRKTVKRKVTKKRAAPKRKTRRR